MFTGSIPLLCYVIVLVLEPLRRFCALLHPFREILHHTTRDARPLRTLKDLRD